MAGLNAILENARTKLSIRSAYNRIIAGSIRPDNYPLNKEFKELKKFDLDLSLPYWMKLIKSKNYVLMKDACYHLGTIKSDKAVPHSVKLLEDKNHFYDLDVVLALGKIGSEKAVVPLMNWRGLDRFVAREAISMIRDSVLKRKLRIDSNNPELLALYHLNPLYYPKAFEKFLMQARKGKNKSEKHWELTAKELMAMEGRLK